MRSAPALKPVSPSSEISIDGISLRRRILGVWSLSRGADHATRNSLDMLLPKTLFSHMFERVLVRSLSVVKPGGVTWPVPESPACRS